MFTDKGQSPTLIGRSVVTDDVVVVVLCVRAHASNGHFLLFSCFPCFTSFVTPAYLPLPLQQFFCFIFSLSSVLPSRSPRIFYPLSARARVHWRVAIPAPAGETSSRMRHPGAD